MAPTRKPADLKSEDRHPADDESGLDLDVSVPDVLGAGIASIAVIGPDKHLRDAVCMALAECYDGELETFATYPLGLEDVPELLGRCHDVVLIELDSQPDSALELIEGICSKGTATVMVYSSRADAESSSSEMLVHCMRAGAREFFGAPFEQSAMAEALVRAAVRGAGAHGQRRTGGRQFLFMGTKGGCGVTTAVCNYAVAMAREGEGKTILIDLNLPLGDAALNLGLTAEYSTVNALQNIKRLDAQFLNKLLVQHESGLWVLASPGKLPSVPVVGEAVEHLLTVARQSFDSVLVDLGTGYEAATPSLLSQATMVYLVTQAGLPELRNANRLITQRFHSCGANYEIVLNRFESRRIGVTDQQMLKALTRQPKWKIPNDYEGVRRMQSGVGAFDADDNPIYTQLQKMAREDSGDNSKKNHEKHKGFSFFGIGKSKEEKKDKEEEISITQLHIADLEEKGAIEENGGVPESIGRLVDSASGSEKNIDHMLRAEEKIILEWDTPESICYGTRLGAEQLKARASAAGVFVYTPSENYLLPAGNHTLWVSFMPRDVEDNMAEMLQASVLLTVNKATPSIVWPRTTSIPQGVPLSAAQLNASADISGHFEYDHTEGEVLEEGTHTLQVQFSPEDQANYTSAWMSVQIEITKKVPVLKWDMPEPITFGEVLTQKHLKASASVQGSYSYTPNENALLPAGEQELLVEFTPEDLQQYAPTQMSVRIVVRKAVPVVQWAPLAALAHGDRLNEQHLNAQADVPGSFSYQPALGAVLPVGEQTLSCVFTPKDDANYESIQVNTHLQVSKATPVIQWKTPDPIEYGTPLNSMQLNAATSVPGKMLYLPSEGAVLGAGIHTPLVQFVPEDEGKYNRSRASVELIVNPCRPVVQWNPLSPIRYGMSLGPEQLCAQATVPGRFQYHPSEGEILPEGTHRLLVEFQPSDATNYETVCAESMLVVSKAEPVDISWSVPEAIFYGTALSEKQLNASTSLIGSFYYTPAIGEILAAGEHVLTAKFVPEDKNLPVSLAHVQLTIEPVRPQIHWTTPMPMVYGKQLSDDELNARSEIPGKFTYTPASGEILPAGTHSLTAVFTPDDEKNYTREDVGVILRVTAQTPLIRWNKPAPIAYGTPLSQDQLNAVATAPGTFVYAPSQGTVMAEGKQKISATFIPKDRNNFNSTQAVMELEVQGFIEMRTFPFEEMASAISEGTSSVPATKIPLDRSVRTVTKQNLAPVIVPKKSVSETRTYKGLVYEKGVDGQWYLQQK